MTLPGSPADPNSKKGIVQTPAIHPIGVCIMTGLVPEGSQELLGTVFVAKVIVSIPGGELHFVVISQRVSCGNTSNKISRLVENTSADRFQYDGDDTFVDHVDYGEDNTINHHHHVLQPSAFYFTDLLLRQ